MKPEQLDYELPAELIAHKPAELRSESRLLVLDRAGNELIDSRFKMIGNFLAAGDCLVLNDTKVLAARFFFRRATGAKLEGLFVAEHQQGEWEVMLKGAARLKTGETIYLRDPQKHDFCPAVVLEKSGQGRCRLRLQTEQSARSVLEKAGFAPLPPYIKRGDDIDEAKADRIRYQTVYARNPGAIAAPTAGLHFTEELIAQLKASRIRLAFLTLHVGPGTFKPITAEKLEKHKMESERFSIDAKAARTINSARKRKGRIIAVGTTSVRALETAAAGSIVKPGSGETHLFIMPGHKFEMVDALVTNFHLPRSTLLALVAAFAGLEKILRAYRHAVRERYRFYSYGDAMLIL